MTAIPVAVNIGMKFAREYTGASAVFVTGRRARTVAIFHDGAARAWGSPAGLADAARSDAASSGNACAGNGPKKGVMTYDADMSGRQAVRACAAATMAGS